MTGPQHARPPFPDTSAASVMPAPDVAPRRYPRVPPRVRRRRFPPWPACAASLPDLDPQESTVSPPTDPTGPGTRPASLFARIGGPATLRAIVEIFYDRVLADPALAPYFRGVDDRRLRSHQRWFLGAVLGGPDTYTGRDLRTAHAGLGITETAFDLVAEHLLAAFADFGTTEVDRAEIAETLTAYRPMIVDGSFR